MVGKRDGYSVGQNVLNDRAFILHLEVDSYLLASAQPITRRPVTLPATRMIYGVSVLRFACVTSWQQRDLPVRLLIQEETYGLNLSADVVSQSAENDAVQTASWHDRWISSWY